MALVLGLASLLMMPMRASESLADGGAANVRGPLPDPSARLLRDDQASEAWTLYVELDSGQRISQRFLLTNAGPGEHTAVAVGHFMEPGRAPYRYENGRQQGKWTLSDDRLFFDIAASHLDLHRPTGELRITKDDIEIRLFFDFAPSDLSVAIPRKRLPSGYAVDILAVGAPTRGTVHAPWMSAPRETTGRTWMAHSWSGKAEAKLVTRRIDVYGSDGDSVFYGFDLLGTNGSRYHWLVARNAQKKIIESAINVPEKWTVSPNSAARAGSRKYPLPAALSVIQGTRSGRIALDKEWLRFDPLDVIPNPFRWFIRRNTKPQEVWADAQIDVTLLQSPVRSPHPHAAGAIESETESNSERETEHTLDTVIETKTFSGVSAITFTNPIDRR